MHIDKFSKWLFHGCLGTDPFHILGEMLISTWLKETPLLLPGEARLVCVCTSVGLNTFVRSVDLVQWFTGERYSHIFIILESRMSTHGNSMVYFWLLVFLHRVIV